MGKQFPDGDCEAPSFRLHEKKAPLQHLWRQPVDRQRVFIGEGQGRDPLWNATRLAKITDFAAGKKKEGI